MTGKHSPDAEHFGESRIRRTRAKLRRSNDANRRSEDHTGVDRRGRGTNQSCLGPEPFVEDVNSERMHCLGNDIQRRISSQTREPMHTSVEQIRP